MYIYTEVKNSNITKEVARKYVFDNIKERVNSNNALQTHEAIMSVLGHKRYTLFKQSAEHYLKNNWNCSAMMILMH